MNKFIYSFHLFRHVYMKLTPLELTKIKVCRTCLKQAAVAAASFSVSVLFYHYIAYYYDMHTTTLERTHH